MEELFEFGFGDRADDLLDDVSPFEEQQCGDGADGILLSCLCALVDIEFSDAQALCILFGDFFDDGSDSAARAAPGCPEVHEDGQGRLEDMVLKLRIRNFLGKRHNFSFL